jgi:hypothetical protein
MAIPEVELKDSFLYDCMVKALKAEPTWTVRMFGVYNDLTDDLIAELEALWRAEGGDRG